MFKVGTVVNRDKTLDKNFTQLAAQQFDVVSFENEMKGYSLIDVGASKTATEAGDQGVVACQFGTADEMVQWAVDNKLKVVDTYYSGKALWLMHSSMRTMMKRQVFLYPKKY